MFGGKLVSYAQNAEDLRLWGYFRNLGKKGFYVDVGANHPLNDSVTRFYYLRGWRGINIEPQADLCQLLKAERPRDINLSVGLSDKKEKRTLRKYQSDGLSTYADDYKASYETGSIAGTKAFSEAVSMMDTLAGVLSRYAKRRDIHFLKVDVEGFEYKVVKGNDWKRFRPWVVCVESTGQDRRWQAVLQKAGYSEHIFDGLNSYYVADERRELIDNYRTVTASESVRFDVLNSLPIRLFGLAGAARRKLFNRD